MKMKVIRSKRHLALVVSNDQNDFTKVDGYIAIHPLYRIETPAGLPDAWLGVVRIQTSRSIPFQDIQIFTEGVRRLLSSYSARIDIQFHPENRDIIILLYLPPGIPQERLIGLANRFKTALKKYEIMMNPMDCLLGNSGKGLI